MNLDANAMTHAEPRPHTCDTCGKTERWNESWSWYGSYRQMEDGQGVLEICSSDCRPSDPQQALLRKRGAA